MLEVRQAQLSDCDLIHRWRNHLDIREHMFDKCDIPYQQHCAWFENVLTSSEIILLVGIKQKISVGVLKFSLLENLVEVGIYLNPELVGKGTGSELLQAGEQWLKQNKPHVEKIIAKIQPHNERSLKLFTTNNYSHKYFALEKEIE